MPEIGKYNELTIARKTDLGFILSNGNEDILLPYHHAPKDIEVGDSLFAFVFLNKEGNLQATAQKPYACVGDFACLTVVDETDGGVFMGIGVDKDVFVPNMEQKRPMAKGESYVVYVYLDQQTNRMLASSKLTDFVEEEDITLEEGDEVGLLIIDRSDLGYNAIINNKYIGLLYHNELFVSLRPGDLRKGWVKKVRIEGKIDLSLQPIGYGHILDTKEGILAELKASGGVINLGDKSDPQDIYRRFQISKSAFKKTIGALYKERLILISDNEIKLVDMGTAIPE